MVRTPDIQQQEQPPAEQPFPSSVEKEKRPIMPLSGNWIPEPQPCLRLRATRRRIEDQRRRTIRRHVILLVRFSLLSLYLSLSLRLSLSFSLSNLLPSLMPTESRSKRQSAMAKKILLLNWTMAPGAAQGWAPRNYGRRRWRASGEVLRHLMPSCDCLVSPVEEQWIPLHLNQTNRGLGLSSLPQPEERSFMGWWSDAAPKDLKKGLNSLFILVVWEVWKHRNACVFERVNPEVLVVLQNIANEGSLWCSAGAKDLRFLLEGARAQGTRGGILVAWRQGIIKSDRYRVHRHSVSIRINIEDEPDWWFTGVYGPHQDADKVGFLEELREVREFCTGPWVIGGDFNMIYCAEDKNNENLNRAMMGRFRRFVNDHELKEIPLIGRRYTWSNEQEAPTLVKLDRVLCTSDWEDIFPDCILQSQASQISDHCPLLLGLKEGRRGKMRFHFESFWTKLPDFQDVVAQSWGQPVTASCPMEQVAMKLKRLTRVLQSWSQKQVGHIKTQLGLAREILHRLEIAQVSRVLTPEEDWLRCEAKRYCLVLSSMERTIARLRSRIRFLKDGDANTALFHSQARFRKNKNFIPKLLQNGEVVTGQEEKQAVFFDYFDGLIGTPVQRASTLNLDFFHREGIDLSALDAPITEEEVWLTIKDLPSDRAPGPDGYTGRFYKSCWQIIKTDFMAAIITLQQGDARKLWLLNSAYLTLIPKKEEALLPTDFRPISLVHSFAKLDTKILANRLAPLLKDLVASNQSAFVRGRCIHDNYMLVQQTIKLLHKRKVPSIFLKLDISKAFDSVSWAFLLEILQFLGFGNAWCNLISRLLTTASTRILVNGEPGEEIRHKRGLRQGDPLSPMLFILVMDTLNSLFIKAEEMGLLQPLTRGFAGQRISLYADDVALFIKPSVDEMNLTTQILEVFGEASGLRTNLQKSCVIPIRCEERETIASTLACSVSEFPCIYLGLPISDRKLKKADLLHWVERIGDKLPGWKANLMNMAGRATWVRFVLSALPIHVLIALNVPKWFIKAINKIRRAFLWKGRREVHGGCCLVAWEKVQRPLELVVWVFLISSSWVGHYK
ncbi:LOW QUALITY PROTEIN: hypothetical protein U9M48_026563 [Paspalum notatum var. saurae]|uniref:Reverse transcriptase domain-containing protein n=1 Tax=Paspalum notatum var. saurae TaxID=547442 RepID=A0AAQ3TVI9_PASNO